LHTIRKKIRTGLGRVTRPSRFGLQTIGDIVSFLRMIRHSTPKKQEPSPSPVSRDMEMSVDSSMEEEALPAIEVSAEDLHRWIAENADFQIIDVREPYELQNGFLQNSWNVPMNSIPDEMLHIDPSQRLVIACAAGMRSYGVATYLREQGFRDVWSLSGGVAEWSSQGFLYPQRGKFAVGSPVKVAIRHISGVDVAKGYGWVQHVYPSTEDASRLLYSVGYWNQGKLWICSDVPEEDISYYKV
jgi:rhodanese-related sulfurtransferase